MVQNLFVLYDSNFVPKIQIIDLFHLKLSKFLKKILYWMVFPKKTATW